MCRWDTCLGDEQVGVVWVLLVLVCGMDLGAMSWSVVFVQRVGVGFLDV